MAEENKGRDLGMAGGREGVMAGEREGGWGGWPER